VTVRVGIGGWSFPPWRGVFYPKGVSAAKELAFASKRMTAIEINSTFYGRQPKERFAAWAATTPEGFVFSVKGSRFVTNRRDLRTAAEALDVFMAQGVAELGAKLGPLVWQLAPTKTFDADEIAGFLELLPETLEGLALRHVLDARHESFKDPAFVALARAKGVGIVLTDSPKFPLIADPAGPITYIRLMRAEEDIVTGYASEDLALWARRATAFERGEEPDDLKLLAPPLAPQPRDVFVFMINGAKVRAPAAAEALLRSLAKTAD
jgi:uncharacterized protein YecE (DUF72 family)